MQSVVLLILLVVCAVEDLKHKEVTVTYILVFGIIGVLLHLFYPNCSVYSMLWGLLLGIAVMTVSVLSGGSIGMGDGILMTVTGVYLGGYQNLELFFIGVFLAGIWSLGLLVFKKKKRKEKIAFMPFLLVAYVFMLVG
ncbi:prepilin peptidase [Roseburia sp. 499]|uniref:prepilin peptidase n=1 Tax=Roseburia sp. 499 TaxID=1261634 RepID=UPI000951F990|nr:prepilin peptidase [Roseburia sp. 499]WVK69856.1 prepilin peptidase [Roseburia sp. 499]